jgi:lysophospholipase L1-like esterase
MKKIISRCLLAIGMVTGMAFMLPPKKITLYMIGDSTMCNYPIRQWPVTGWGMPFANYFDSTVVIDNRAKGGRSTRTFLSENRWQPIADSLHAGDYVFIQFGHNDEAKEPQYADRYTPVPAYKANLIRFITDTRARNAIPVLVTPVSRRNFDKDGNAKETHTEYTRAVLEVGDQYHVAVIDLDRQSRELYQRMGPDNAKLLFMELDPGEHPNYHVGRHDGTHFNEYGARKIAEIVLNDIQSRIPDLAGRIVRGNHEAVVNPSAK